MTPFKSDAILLVVSSPVDLLTSLALKLSQLPPSQVLGSGTYLDSVRLRGMLADNIEVSDCKVCSEPRPVNDIIRLRRSQLIYSYWGCRANLR